MFLDGQAMRDEIDEHKEELAVEREEEILMRASIIGQRRQVDPLLVLEILRENDRITVETEPLP
jgi:hypothetical protein